MQVPRGPVILFSSSLCTVKFTIQGILVLFLVVVTGCAQSTKLENEQQQAADAFLRAYEVEYQRLTALYTEGEWAANTMIIEGDSSRVEAAAEARQAYADFTGASHNIETAQALLKQRDQLQPIQVRQLERVLYLAASNPATEPELVKELIDKEGRMTQDLFGFDFTVNGISVSTNEMDAKLRESTDLDERQLVWEASKEVGVVLKEQLADVRDLRNGVVQAMGYPDYLAYQVSDYGMSTQEMQAMMDRLIRELRPLYRELHTWTRYELAARYGSEVPEYLPAHWLPNRWAQDWSALVDVEGADLDSILADEEPEWILRQAEDFYVSMGFEPLPASFYTKSSAYPLPPDATYKKNNHASAWHMNLDQDVRTLMSIEPNAEWYETTHHELGHIYYYLAYSHDGVPLLLRDGANRAFHEAIGSQMGLAAMQIPFLVARGLIDADTEIDKVQLLMREALNNVVFLSFGAGTMPNFERALYEDRIPSDQFNQVWWDLVKRYQGVVPPTDRGSYYADGLSKTHIINDPAQYYDYALSFVLLFQIHDYVASELMGQAPQETNYYGNKKVGKFLRSILEPGATRDWRELTREVTGQDLTAEPMLRYFEPLREWLQEQNSGRVHTLSDF